MPHPTLTKIFGKPTQPTLTLMHSEILANAMAVPSDGGDGQLGHARLVLSANAYATASHGHVAYITPVKPARVEHAINATQETMYRTDQDYNIDLAAWKLHHDTEKKLLQQLLAAVDNIFTKALKNNLWGYARTTTLALLTHLAGTYGKISPEDMIANRVQLNHPWTPPDDIENHFDNINTCIEFAEAGGDPISEVNAVQAGVATLRKTGLFAPAIREWNANQADDQTRTHFTDFFRQAEVDRQLETTATAAGYHQANAIETQTLSTADSSMTAATLATTMAALQQMMLQATAATATANANTAATTAPRVPLITGQRYVQPLYAPTPVELVTMGYCWSHGHCVNPLHNSLTCNYKKEGHIDAATAANKRGGCTSRFAPRIGGSRPPP
jgi:hypothetical protein